MKLGAPSNPVVCEIKSSGANRVPLPFPCTAILFLCDNEAETRQHTILGLDTEIMAKLQLRHNPHVRHPLSAKLSAADGNKMDLRIQDF